MCSSVARQSAAVAGTLFSTTQGIPGQAAAAQLAGGVTARRSGGIFYFEEIYPPLYANPLLKALLRHPREDRFDEPQFLAELSINSLCLVEGFQTGSRFGIVGAARKM